MTLVNDSPHVASLLRINISKFGYALQAFFILRYSPHVASLLRINISKLGCALQAYLTKSIHRFTAFSLTGKTASIALRFVCVLLANFISRYSPHVASLLRINISKFSCDLQAWFVKSFYRFTAFSLTGKTASIALRFICVPWTWFIKSNRKEHTVHFA